MKRGNDKKTFKSEFGSALAKFCSALSIDPSSQAAIKTIKQFLVISGTPSGQLEAAYSKIGDDFQMVQYRSGRGLEIYSDPTSAPTYSASFWKDLFGSTDVSSVNDLGIYNNFKELMEIPLKGCLEWEKVMAYYLTTMKHKHGEYIAEKLLSKKVGRAVEKFDGLTEKELADGLGSMIAILEFPDFAEVKFRYSIEDAQNSVNQVKRRIKSTTKECCNLTSVPPKTWNTGAKRKYSATAIIKKYRNVQGVKSHHPGKHAFKHVLGSIIASEDDWENISNEFGASGVKRVSKNTEKLTQKEFKEKLFNAGVVSSDWVPFLTVLDHCDLTDLLKCDEVKEFIGTCKKAVASNTFSKWSNVGVAKKFLTVYTSEWNDVWEKNWKIDQGLKRAIMAYKKTHKKLQTDTVKALCNL